MALSLIILSFLLPPLSFNPPQDTTLGQRYEAAQELVRAGKLAEAETELKAILAAQYRRLMKTYGALQKREQGLEAGEAAANYQSPDSDVLIELAVAYLEAAQFSKALDPLLKAARLQPGNADVHRTLGKTYFALGDYEKSASALEVAVKLAPKDFNSSFTLAITYLQQRQFTAARRVFDSMIAEFGEHPQIHIPIGRAFREAGRLPEAIEEFKRAIALNSQFPGAHYNLGLAYLWNEGGAAVANAEEEFKIELAANPNDFFSNYYLGITCIFQRKWELAIDLLRTASRIQPNNPDPYFQLGQAYQELKKHDQAIEVLKKAIELNPNLPHNKFQVTTAHYRLAQSLLQTGQTEASRKELQVASELKARAFEITQSLSSKQPTMGASRVPDENATETQASLDQKTRSELEANEAQLTKIISALHNSLGLVQAGRQNLAGAAVEFRLAKKWNPQQVGLDYNLGLAYFRAESYREALAPLESEIKSNPANTQARWLLGLSYFKTQDYSKAAELLHDVPSSGSTNVELYYAFGKALLQQGNFAGAVSNLEMAVKLDPENALFHYELGRAYTAAGRREEGKREDETFNKLKKPQ